MKTLLRERLQDQLNQLPDVLNGYDKGGVFVEHALRWLSQLEALLKQFRQPLVSLPSAQRGIILAAQDGYLDKMQMTQPRALRKAVRGTTAHSLQAVELEIRAHIGAIDAELYTARMQMAQLLSVVSAQSPLPMPDTNPVPEAWLRSLWQSLPLTAEVRPMYAYLNTALPAIDRLYLLGELLTNLWDV